MNASPSEPQKNQDATEGVHETPDAEENPTADGNVASPSSPMKELEGDGVQGTTEENSEYFIDEGPISPKLGAVEENRENARTWIAKALTGVAALVLLLTVIGASFGSLADEQIDLILTAGLPPIVTLLGTAMGFYFGSSK